MAGTLIRGVAWATLILLGVNASSWLATSVLRARHFDEPDHLGAIMAPYPAYLGEVARGQLGELPGREGQSVAGLIARTLPRSAILVALTMLIALPAGVVAAYLSLDNRRRRMNSLAVTLSLVGLSAPAFYLGILAIEALLLSNPLLGRAGKPTLLPAMGYGIDRHLVLPVAVLAVRPMAEITRLSADAMARELKKDYVRAAIAKGLSWRMVVLGHVLPNVMPYAIVAAGTSLRHLASSLIVAEVLFGWSGIGRALAVAIAPRIDGRPDGALLYAPEAVAGMSTALAALFLILHGASRLAVHHVDRSAPERLS